MRIRKMKNLSKLSGVLVACLLLSACASNVVVKGEVPAPLVNKLPLTGSLVYTDAFKNYTYVESQKRRKSVVAKFDFKDAQIGLFDRIFGALLTLVGNEAPNKDLTIEPEILDFQYATPTETGTTQYEVWLKYRIKILDSDQQKVGDWVVKGYGKTPTATLQSTAAAFNSAANVALRDVGAQLAIRFPTQSSVQEVIAAKSDTQSISYVVKESVSDDPDEVAEVTEEIADTAEAELDQAAPEQE